MTLLYGLMIALVVLNLSNVLLHSIGFSLLVELHMKSTGSIQRVFLISLSMTEIISNILAFMFHLPWLRPGVEDLNDDWRITIDYLAIIYDYLVCFTFYMTMSYLTIDRLVCSILNLKYPIYCRPKRATYLMIGTWLFSIVMVLTLSICYHYYPTHSTVTFFIYTHYTYNSVFVMYASHILTVLFILLATISYLIIFKKYVGAQRRRTVREEERGRNVFQIFRHSGFFIPLMLVVTWILFNFIPTAVYIHYIVQNLEMSGELDVGLWILYAIADISDGTIYIFLKNDVRKLLLRKIFCYTRVYSSSQRTVTISAGSTQRSGQVCTVTTNV